MLWLEIEVVDVLGNVLDIEVLDIGIVLVLVVLLLVRYIFFW